MVRSWKHCLKNVTTVLTLIIFSVCIPSFVLARSYSITRLCNVSEGGYTSLNDLGELSGYTRDSEGHHITAALETTSLGTLGGAFSYAAKINNLGQVVGSSYTDDNEMHAFLYENGNMQDLGTLGGSNSYATSLNDLGQVVGSSYTADNKMHAFVYENGNMQDIGTLGGNYSYATGINDLGQVVGSSYTADNEMHVFFYENGNMQDMGTLEGSLYSYARDINNNGQVIGSSLVQRDDRYYWASFLWENGELTELERDGYYSYATSINDNGLIVGMNYSENSISSAVLWEDGLQTDLSSFLSEESRSQWQLTYAADINTYGQILGYGKYNGEYSAFLMTPDDPLTSTSVPEPLSIMLLGLGVASIIGKKIKKQ